MVCNIIISLVRNLIQSEQMLPILSMKLAFSMLR